MPKQKRTFDVLVEAKLRIQAFDAEAARRKAERSLRRGRDIDLDVVAAGDVSAKPQEAATTPVRRVAKPAPGRTTAAKAGNTAKKTTTSRVAPPVVKKTASKGARGATTKKARSRKAAAAATPVVKKTASKGARGSTTKKARSRKAAATTQQTAGAKKRPAHKRARRP